MIHRHHRYNGRAAVYAAALQPHDVLRMTQLTAVVSVGLWPCVRIFVAASKLEVEPGSSFSLSKLFVSAHKTFWQRRTHFCQLLL